MAAAMDWLGLDGKCVVVTGGSGGIGRATLAAFHITFFGTQPTLTQVPPRRPASTSATLAPCFAALRADASPPLPPPITT